MGGFWIYGQWQEEDFHPVVYELLSVARRLAPRLGEKVTVVVLGAEDRREQAETLLAYGVEEVLCLVHPELSYFRDDVYAAVLAEAVRERTPAVFLFGATAEGQALAPRLAGLLELGLTAHCTDFEVDEEGRLVQIRPSFGENVMARIVSRTRPQMATVRPGVFPRAQPVAEPRGLVEEVKLSAVPRSAIRRKARRRLPRKESPLSGARVVVAGGRGLQNRENFARLSELADLLGAAVGATRPVCHLGWISEDHMIGVSGKTVSPKLYLGFGISGALQHTVGIEGAEVVVAVNTDPEAPLMKRADIAVVGDATRILPLLIRRIRGIKEGNHGT